MFKKNQFLTLLLESQKTATALLDHTNLSDHAPLSDHLDGQAVSVQFSRNICLSFESRYTTFEVPVPVPVRYQYRYLYTLVGFLPGAVPVPLSFYTGTSAGTGNGTGTGLGNCTDTVHPNLKIGLPNIYFFSSRVTQSG